MKKYISILLILIIILTGCKLNKDFMVSSQLKAAAVEQQKLIEEKQRLEAEAKARVEEEKRLEEEKAKKEAEEKAKLAAEEKARLEAEALAKAAAEQKAKELASQPKPAATPAPTPKPQAPASTPQPPNTTQGTQGSYPVEYLTEVENEVLRLCNIERSKAGVKPLQGNETLRQIARYKSNDMLQYNYFDHTSLKGDKPWGLAKRFNYTYTAFGENIWMRRGESSDPGYEPKFRAQVTAQSIVNDWMNSSGHKANILNANFGRLGVGIAYSTKLKVYATQSFSN